MHSLIGVVSLDLHRGMGYRGQLLARLKADMVWFSRLTKEHSPGEPLPTVIMGRKTWDSLPDRYRPLPDRKNYVLTRGQILKEGIVYGNDWDTLLTQAEKSEGKVFVIGGAQVFRLALQKIKILYVTEFQKSFLADTFFPPFEEEFPYRQIMQMGEERGIIYKIIEYRREKILEKQEL